MLEKDNIENLNSDLVLKDSIVQALGNFLQEPPYF